MATNSPRRTSKVTSCSARTCVGLIDRVGGNVGGKALVAGICENVARRKIRQRVRPPIDRPARFARKGCAGRGVRHSGWVRMVVVVHIHHLCDGHLLGVGKTCGAPGFLLRFRQGRERHTGQDCDNSDGNQQFDQSESESASRLGRAIRGRNRDSQFGCSWHKFLWKLRPFCRCLCQVAVCFGANGPKLRAECLIERAGELPP